MTATAAAAATTTATVATVATAAAAAGAGSGNGTTCWQGLTSQTLGWGPAAVMGGLAFGDEAAG
ncbi:MAG: hypothetical protein LC749_21595 [Actinobacteria bacterium]|nr:hypothetical protein [Actinomycetota bacterium]